MRVGRGFSSESDCKRGQSCKTLGGEGCKRVGHDFGVMKLRDCKVLPCMAISWEIRDAGYGMSSYGVTLNLCRAGSGENSTANRRGEKWRERSDKTRRLASANGVLEAVHRSKSMVGSTSTGSPLAMTSSSSRLGQEETSVTRGSS